VGSVTNLLIVRKGTRGKVLSLHLSARLLHHRDAEMRDFTARNGPSYVVGYQNKELTLGGNAFVVQTFMPIGIAADAIKLSNIGVSAEWDAAEGDFIARLLPSGASSAEYTYLSEEYSEALGGSGAGWYMLDEVNDGDVSLSGIQNNVTLPFAEGFLAYNNTGATLTFAGEVTSGDTELLTTLGGNAFSGNVTPIDIKIGDLTVSDDWDAAEGDFLAILLPSGASAAEYTYLNDEYAEALGGAGAGWYMLDEVNDGDVSVSGCQNTAVTITAGQGFMIYQNTGATVIVPSAL